MYYYSIMVFAFGFAAAAGDVIRSCQTHFHSKKKQVVGGGNTIKQDL